MKMRLKHILLVLAFFSGSISSFAQNINATAGIDSTVILIGNQAHIRIRFNCDKSASPKITWPVITDSLVSKVKVVSKSKIDSTSTPTQKAFTQELTITSFDSGYYAIPPFQFIVNGDTTHPVLTDALMLQVRTIPVDTTKAFRDIKGPIQVKFPLIVILEYIGIALAILAVIGLIIYFIIKNRKKEAPVFEAPIPVIDPDIKALAALDELVAKKLWQEGKIKEYYSGISDILRIYLDDRFNMGALEMTTDEIMYTLRRVNLENSSKIQLNQILMLSDLVKFAKEQPLPAEHESTMNNAIEFVKQSTAYIKAALEHKPENSAHPTQPTT